MTKKILLADDSVTIQKVIELTFMDQDYEVLAVSNGDEALERLEASRPDLVIADVHMPGASGYEVARRSKDHDATIPVLLLVGTFEPFEESEMEASGADAHLKKPFDSQELLELVEGLLEGGGAAPEAEDSASEVSPTAPGEAPGAVGAEPSEAPPAAAGEALGELQLDEGLEQEEAVWGNLDLDATEEPGLSTEEPFDEDLSLPAEDEEEPSFAAALEDDEEEAPLAAALEEEDAEKSEPFRLGDGGDAFSLEEQPAPPPPASPATAETNPPPSGSIEAPPTEPAPPEAEASSATEPAPTEPSGSELSGEVIPTGGLSEEDVDRIAKRVVDLIGGDLVREVAWEVIPDLAEIAIKDRIRELESQVE